MNEELIEYYIELLIIQYKNKPNARGTISAYITALMIYQIAIDVRDGYDIDTAVGVQLDILGKYTGVNRVVTGVDFTRTYWGFLTYAETPPKIGISGFANYSNNPDVQTRSYYEEGGNVLELTDEEYRLFQRLKIRQNYSNASLKDIDDLLMALFNGTANVADDGTMNLVYTFSANQTRIVTIANSEGLIPRPMGVSLQIGFS